MQSTSHILMVRPVAFGFNPETSVNNAFQSAGVDTDINEKAQKEFDYFVEVLRTNEIDVTVIDDTAEPHTPDSIFPNNWASYHEDGTVVIYPMFAPNRRVERDKGILERLKLKFLIRTVENLSDYEGSEIFLEGTGSMILDRDNEIAYACLSPRTHPTAFYDFCGQFGYTPVLFSATDADGRDIYHTNVMLCIGEEFAVICIEAVTNGQEKQVLLQKFEETDKELIQISLEQMNQFAGNMLQVQNAIGDKFLVMSTQAFKSITPHQVERLKLYNTILHAPLYTIEQHGGGSARCMMAEIFLPLKNKLSL